MLLTLLRKKPYSNNLFYILAIIILLILSLKYTFIYILLGLLLVYIIIKKSKLLLPILIIVSLFVIRIIIDNMTNKLEIKDTYQIYVSDVIDDNKYIAYTNNKKILLYDNNKVKPGDIYEAKISFYDDEYKNYDTDFDTIYYYKSKGITKCGKVTHLDYIKSTFSIYSIKYYYSNYLKDNLSKESYDYVNALVFGDNNLDTNIKDSYSILGISHILAISGMHIIFLFNIISFILLKVFHYYKRLIPIAIISIFIILIGAPLSSVRALLFLILSSINIGKNRYSRLDILSISCLIMLLINPYYLYNTGFILSFLVSGVIILIDMLFKKSDSKLFSMYRSYLMIFIITLPFVINISGRISLVSIILSPIISFILGYILLPISYILGIIPITDFIFKYIFIGINLYIVNLGDIIPIIHFEAFNIYMIVIYYVLFLIGILGIYKNKGIISFMLLFIFILSIYGIRYINPIGRITFISCGQGDSAVVELPNNKGVMVIDCFNSIEYLRKRGINNIDYLVLTHSDNDHIGDYKEIINEFNVNNIFYPKYDDKFDDLLIDYKNKYPITDLSKINSKEFNFEILGPINKYDDPNSNSIVLKLNMYNTSILFTGDMTVKEESDLIEKYDYRLDSDILKVAHHGSDTSSSIKFLNLVSQRYSIISVGKNNSYGLPNKEIVERLDNISDIYMTKDNGNIDIYIYNDKLWVKPYRN